MKRLLLPLLLGGLLGVGPALHAQFDFSKLTNTLKDAKKLVKGAAGIGPEEEKIIGDSVALEIVGQYGGLVREEAAMRRVNLVGRALARYSARPELNWRFGVLDSDTVNAFSAPDGYVFITRGLYALAQNDDTLAAILGHEIAHITGRHALKIVERGEFLSGLSSQLSARSGQVREIDAQLQQFVDTSTGKIVETLFKNGFDPLTEYAADHDGRQLAVITGYAPGSLRGVLTQLQHRGDNPQQVFPTHPPLQERISRLPDEPAPSSSPPAS